MLSRPLGNFQDKKEIYNLKNNSTDGGKKL